MATNTTPAPMRQPQFITPPGVVGGQNATNDGAPNGAPQSQNSQRDVGLKAAVERSGGQSIYDNDAILAELKLQNDIFCEKDPSKKEELWNALRERVLGSTDPMVFAGVLGGFLRPFHSIHKYGGDFYNASAFDNKIFCFVGDRRLDRPPRSYILKEAHLEWLEIEDLVVSESVLRIFFQDNANHSRMYKQKEGDTKQSLTLPPLYLVPRGMVAWLAERPRTLMAYHDELLSRCGGASIEQRPAVLEFSTTWCRAMSNANPVNAETSVAEMELREVFGEDDERLDAWIKARLNTTLGRMQDTSTPTQVINNFITNAPAGEQPNFGGNTSGGRSTTNSGGVVKFSDLQEAKMKGYCNTVRRSDIPAVWTKILNASKIDELRKHVMDAFEEARKTLGIDKSELTQMYLDDAWLKDLQKLIVAPGGEIMFWDWLMRGMSMLACMNWTAEEILVNKNKNKVYNETTNKTEEQVERHNFKEVREPPKEWSKLKYLFNTYCILIRALFTMYCEHFRACWTLRNAIADMSGVNEKYFNQNGGHLCKLLVWLVLVDSRKFFSRELGPSDFENATDLRMIPGRPISHLARVALDVSDLRLQALEVINFPSKWRSDDKKRTIGEQGGRTTGGPADWKGAQYGRNFSGGHNFGGGSGGYNQQRQQNGDKHSTAPKQIWDALGPLIDQVRRRFRKVYLRDICKAGRFFVQDLPTLPGYVGQDGKSNICYIGLLGLCSFEEGSCHNKKVQQKDLTADFVNKFVDRVKPALESMLQSGGGGGMGDYSRYGRPGQW